MQIGKMRRFRDGTDESSIAYKDHRGDGDGELHDDDETVSIQILGSALDIWNK